MDTDRRFLSYGAAIASTVIALLLSIWLEDITTQMVGTFYFIAIAVSAWYGGTGPGVATTVLSLVALGYFSISPVHPLDKSALEGVSQLILFGAVALVINLVSAGLREHQRVRAKYDLNREYMARSDVEEQLQHLEAERHRLEQILQRMPVGVAIANAPSGTISFYNEEAARLLQSSISSTKDHGDVSQAVLHTDGALHQPGAFSFVRSFLTGEAIKAKEVLYHWQDCTTATFAVSATPIHDRDGQLVLTICTFEDISDRKRAEESLHESQRFIQQVADASPNILYLYDLQQQCNIYCNREIANVLGYTPTEIQAMGSNLQNLMHPDDLARVVAQQERISHSEDNEIVEFEYRMKDASGQWRWLYSRDAIFSRNGEGQVQQIIGTAQDITSIKQADEIIRQQANQEILLREITQRIRQSLELQTIFDTACQEILCWSQAERVGIFKFEPGSQFSNGEFVAEAFAPGFPSVLATRVHDHCFGDEYAPLYKQGRVQAIADIHQAGLHECHRDILAQFHIRANLIVPLLQGNDLWGLLCIHQCSAPREWQAFEIQVTQAIANQLAIAIQQATLYEQVQSELQVRQQAEGQIIEQLRQQQMLGAIVQRIRESLDLNEILSTVTHLVKETLQGDRVIVFRLFPDGRSQIIEEAVSDGFLSVKARHWDNEVWSQEILDCYWKGKPRIVPDVTDDVWTKCLVDYSQEGQIQSKIVAPILQEVQSNELHRWVNPSEDNKLWGILVIHACRDQRAWRQSEAELLQQIANQLSIAIQQASLFNQLQSELAERQQAQRLLAERNQQLDIFNQELARATRLKDEFLANMSHELRTPLNAILGMSEGLQEQVFGEVNEQQRKGLQTIERTGLHLLELINDILDLAKVESGQIKLNCVPTSVVSLCRLSLDFVKQQAFRKQIQLDLKLSSPLPNLYVDELRIRQVLVNLLNNAVKFTPPEGHITLEVSLPVLQQDYGLEESWLRLAVIDTGIGIAPEYIEKLFKPFVQIDSSLNRQHEGTGLGLALVKRIVELHRGRVGVTSEVGVGSCFTIDLPYVVEPATLELQTPVDPTTEQRQLEQALSPLILLVEDNEDNILTIAIYLEVKGNRLLVARHGHEAIAIAQSEKPDLILMDIQMPGMDGLEAIRRIRDLPNLRTIPIIALTALAMAGDRERCLAAGANDYLSKPVKLKQLNATIQQLLKPN